MSSDRNPVSFYFLKIFIIIFSLYVEVFLLLLLSFYFLYSLCNTLHSASGLKTTVPDLSLNLRPDKLRLQVRKGWWWRFCFCVGELGLGGRRTRGFRRSSRQWKIQKSFPQTKFRCLSSTSPGYRFWVSLRLRRHLTSSMGPDLGVVTFHHVGPRETLTSGSR